jgi:hypothetical protein
MKRSGDEQQQDLLSVRSKLMRFDKFHVQLLKHAPYCEPLGSHEDDRESASAYTPSEQRRCSSHDFLSLFQEAGSEVSTLTSASDCKARISIFSSPLS